MIFSQNETDIDKLVEFRLEANVNTYAACMNKTDSTRLDSHDFTYSNGPYTYHDTYVGGEQIDKVAAKKHSSTAKMELMPGFYRFYSNIFLKIMRTTDLQESTRSVGRDYYDITIKKCLWHTACVENSCEKLCRLFCDVDDVTYGGLKKIGFTRTKALGYGGDCCDFHFYKK